MYLQRVEDMPTQQELERWASALEILRQHKQDLKEPYLSLVEAYERELKEVNK
jgi:hypothetical protein